MKGGVKQGISNAIKLCGDLTWVNHHIHLINIIMKKLKMMKLKNLLLTLLANYGIFAKKLLSGENDQIILDEIFL